MVIIELNGLPGSGKSTVVNKLISELNANGLKIISLEDVISFRESTFENKLIQLINALFASICMRFNYIVLKMVVSTGISIDRLRYAMRLIKLNYQVSRILNKSSADVLLLDEGFVQFFTSVPHNKRFPKVKVVKEACNYIVGSYPNIRIVNCLLPIETTIERSKSRQSTISRFDNLDAEILEKTLYIKMDNINSMKSYLPKSNQYEINLLEDIDKNVEHLINYVKKSLLHPNI